MSLANCCRQRVWEEEGKGQNGRQADEVFEILRAAHAGLQTPPVCRHMPGQQTRGFRRPGAALSAARSISGPEYSRVASGFKVRAAAGSGPGRTSSLSSLPAARSFFPSPLSPLSAASCQTHRTPGGGAAGMWCRPGSGVRGCGLRFGKLQKIRAALTG